MTTLGVVARLLVAVGQTLLRDADGPGQPARVKRKVKLSTEGVEGVSSDLVEPPIAEATTVELRDADGPGRPAKVKRKVKLSTEGAEGVNWEDLVGALPDSRSHEGRGAAAGGSTEAWSDGGPSTLWAGEADGAARPRRQEASSV